MKPQHRQECHGNGAEQRHGQRMTRRTVLAGLAASMLSGSKLSASAQEGDRPGGRPQPAKPVDGIPGPFPGRVVEVTHAGSVVEDAVQESIAATMVERGMQDLVGSSDAVEAW